MSQHSKLDKLFVLPCHRHQMEFSLKRHDCWPNWKHLQSLYIHHHSFVISIFRLGCCPCPIQWGWQHQAMLNSGSPSICLAGQHQLGQINWYQAWHVQTMSFKAFLSLWGREAEGLWQIWYMTDTFSWMKTHLVDFMFTRVFTISQHWLR